MDNFVFQNHTRIYFGKGVVAEYLAKLLAPYGKNVLLAYGGGSIKRTGVYDAVTAELHAAGKTVFDFPGIMPIPPRRRSMRASGSSRKRTLTSFSPLAAVRPSTAPRPSPSAAATRATGGTTSG